jgi:orotidine-5'-phosphate decarboxylase
MHVSLSQKIIIALDVPSKKDALSLVRKLDRAEIFKIGLELFTAEGPELLRTIQRQGKKVFLDMKLHDIPNTVAGATQSSVRHGIHMLTLHASGGYDMMASASEAAYEEAERLNLDKPRLLAVTILTSLKEQQLKEIGIKPNIRDQLLILASLAQKAGMDGLVCSPHEIKFIKQEYGSRLLIVTPGIRPSWAAAHDQKRIMTPSRAVRKGADYLVIGRPITKAPQPAEAFFKIEQELSELQDTSTHGTHGKDRS